MIKKCCLTAAASLVVLQILAGTTKQASLRTELAAAMRQKDVAEIRRLTDEAIRTAGAEAGVPDAAPDFKPVPKDAKPLSSNEVGKAFSPYLHRLESEQWWQSRPAPQDIPQPLRFVASVVEGCLAARRAGCEEPESLLRMAREAGDFLVWAQAQGGRGVFPFPAWKGKGGRLGGLSDQFLQRAEQSGRLADYTHNGWIVDDVGEGDLQFDNGECGVALLHLYEATRDEKYLHSATAAADWAVQQPVVPNWNYNSFSLFLLSEAFRVTQEPRYLVAAKEKARLGVYPGQLQTGPHAGRWNDPHNARLVYHFILLRGLAAFVEVLPADDPDFPTALATLQHGVNGWLPELLEHGVANGEKVLEFLARVELNPTLRLHLKNYQIDQAFDLVGRFYSASIRQGRASVAPGAWGFYLEAAKKRSGGQ